MKFQSLNGKQFKKNVFKYLIKWDGPSLSKFQFRVKQLLRPYWMNCVVYEEFPCVGSRLKIDILNLTKRIAVEVQGEQHGLGKGGKLHWFHGGSRLNFLLIIKRDLQKMKWLELNNIKLIEIIDTDLNDLVGFYQKFDIVYQNKIIPAK